MFQQSFKLEFLVLYNDWLGFCFPTRFIGELFKLKMLTESIMHDCILRLLRSHDEDSLECLCRLLTTIGKDIDYEKSKVKHRLQSIIAWGEMVWIETVAIFYQSFQDIQNYQVSIGWCLKLFSAAGWSVLPTDWKDRRKEKDFITYKVHASGRHRAKKSKSARLFCKMW